MAEMIGEGDAILYIDPKKTDIVDALRRIQDSETDEGLRIKFRNEYGWSIVGDSIVNVYKEL